MERNPVRYCSNLRMPPLKVRHVRPNPLSDALSFLTAEWWATAVFWLLLVGSAAAAVLVWRADPTQRSIRHIGNCLLRIVVGTMWWQQSLWKIPPDYSVLIPWMQQMVDHASTQLQSRLVRDFVLPNIAVFGPLVYAIEVAIAVSLILGLLTRLGSVLGALMAINLWLGLYSTPGEWPWTYMFLVVLELLYLLDPPGRSLGVDGLAWRRWGASRGRSAVLSLVA
jgi:uncharacterized membrane protein YphA (DoxX/SURF4 family)